MKKEIFLTLSTNNLVMDYNDVIKDIRRIKDTKEVLLLGSE